MNRVAAVLRDAALGDVEPGDDLDSADRPRSRSAAGHGHDVAQQAVDAVADPQLVALRPRRGCRRRAARTASTRIRLTSRTIGASSSAPGRADVLDARARRRPSSSTTVVDVARRPRPSDQAWASWSRIWLSVATNDLELVAAGVQPDVVEGQHVRRVGGGDDEGAVGGPVQHEHAGCARRPRWGSSRTTLGPAGPCATRSTSPQVEQVGQALGDLALGGEAEVDDDLAEALARGPSASRCASSACVELLRGDQARARPARRRGGAGRAARDVAGPAAAVGASAGVLGTPSRRRPKSTRSARQASRRVAPSGRSRGLAPRPACGSALRSPGAAASAPRGRRAAPARVVALRLESELLEQVAQLGAHEVAGGDVAAGRSAARRPRGRGTRCRPRLRSARCRSCSNGDPVAVGLPVLREQDQRRGVGGLQAEDQRQQRVVQRPRVELQVCRRRACSRPARPRRRPSCRR